MQERVNVKHVIDLTDALVVHIWISLRSRKTHRLGIRFSDLIYSLINYKRNLRRYLSEVSCVGLILLACMGSPFPAVYAI